MEQPSKKGLEIATNLGLHEIEDLIMYSTGVNFADATIECDIVAHLHIHEDGGASITPLAILLDDHVFDYLEPPDNSVTVEEADSEDGFERGGNPF